MYSIGVVIGAGIGGLIFGCCLGVLIMCLMFVAKEA